MSLRLCPPISRKKMPIRSGDQNSRLEDACMVAYSAVNVVEEWALAEEYDATCLWIIHPSDWRLSTSGFSCTITQNIRSIDEYARWG